MARWPSSSPGGSTLDPRTHSLLRLGEGLTHTPASVGNQAEMLINAPQTYRSIIQAIEEARDHIHVEFFIIQPDRTGLSLRDRLGDALMSRLYELCRIVTVAGRDYRSWILHAKHHY